MPSPPNRFAWLKSGLLWRTFFLLAFLIAASMVAWAVSFRMVERTPRANQIAAQVVSVVTITRAALTHSAPDSRRELLFELASNEGIRIYPLEATDQIELPRDTVLMPVIASSVRERLGAGTRFAEMVNDVAGFWVSFKIDEDEYWLMLDRERIERTSGIQWLGWATVTLLLSLLGAVFISRLINQPLARLTDAARAIAKGRQPEPLPESGPKEIREANRSFNRMVDDLNRIESDRTIILAGISHDLRTPISRMLLEVEMANLSNDTRTGMHSDLAQMDAIIGQFLDYAKPANKSHFKLIDLSALLTDATQEAARLPNVYIQADIAKDVVVEGNVTELRRVFNNLIENARRYAQTGHTGKTDIDINFRAEGNHALIEIADRGPGIPDTDIDKVLKPFTRMDTARGQADGAGLGLAIVERVIKRHRGQLKLKNRNGGGLLIEITIPSSSPQ
ncbi:MAG TPA: ATP-binding protein [Burkholderiaceae bacterium]|jgi:two-component system osmolarity sensor histidine kinase EnvZ|nr:ATP-binding protein [Burkholderiaceae bacterium]